MPRIFGMEVKPWMLWVAGGAAVLVLLMYMRRGGGQQAQIPQGPQDFGMPGGGGGGGVGYSPQPALAEAPSEKLDEFTRQLQDLTLQERRSALKQQESMFELQREQAGILGRLYTETAEAGAALEKERYATMRGIELAQRPGLEKAAAKAPVKCPPGMHPANVPGEGFTCRQLGDPGGGRGFQPFRQIGQVASGFLSGAAAAAPSIGSVAFQAWASNQLIPRPKQTQQTQQGRVGTWERIGTRSGEWATPGINPYGGTQSPGIYTPTRIPGG